MLRHRKDTPGFYDTDPLQQIHDQQILDQLTLLNSLDTIKLSPENLRLLRRYSLVVLKLKHKQGEGNTLGKEELQQMERLERRLSDEEELPSGDLCDKMLVQLDKMLVLLGQMELEYLKNKCGLRELLEEEFDNMELQQAEYEQQQYNSLCQLSEIGPEEDDDRNLERNMLHIKILKRKLDKPTGEEHVPRNNEDCLTQRYLRVAKDRLEPEERREARLALTNYIGALKSEQRSSEVSNLDGPAAEDDEPRCEAQPELRPFEILAEVLNLLVLEHEQASDYKIENAKRLVLQRRKDLGGKLSISEQAELTKYEQKQRQKDKQISQSSTDLLASHDELGKELKELKELKAGESTPKVRECLIKMRKNTIDDDAVRVVAFVAEVLDAAFAQEGQERDKKDITAAVLEAGNEHDGNDPAKRLGADKLTSLVQVQVWSCAEQVTLKALHDCITNWLESPAAEDSERVSDPERQKTLNGFLKECKDQMRNRRMSALNFDLSYLRDPKKWYPDVTFGINELINLEKGFSGNKQTSEPKDLDLTQEDSEDTESEEKHAERCQKLVEIFCMGPKGFKVCNFSQQNSTWTEAEGLTLQSPCTTWAELKKCYTNMQQEYNRHDLTILRQKGVHQLSVCTYMCFFYLSCVCSIFSGR